MASSEEHELLTRTGLGTPMGCLIRRYWIPALFSHQLPEPDCHYASSCSARNWSHFRDSAGRVGLLGQHCAHRGAPLFFGRNEADGLRCVYHGWKYDVAGNCVDMPNEPAESNFKEKIKHLAYPCQERGSVVWTYMGPADLRPGLPEFEWTLVPTSHRYATCHLQECNWLQAVEGGFDVSHIPFLHRGTKGMAGGPIGLAIEHDALMTDFGLICGGGRDVGGDLMRWNTELMFPPFHKIISRFAGDDAPIGAHAWVPLDDESCMNYSIEYRHDRPLRDDEMERSRNWLFIHAETLPGSDRTLLNKDNDYLIDRELQSSGESFTGIKGTGMQDCSMQESMGPIADRSREHLGAGDGPSSPSAGCCCGA